MSAQLWDNSSMSGPVSGATFAGREAELDRLCATLVALDTTGARAVLIGGEAGIGKTRLIEELGDRARAAGTLVATGVCTPAEGGGLPYGPVVGILRDLSCRLDEPTAAPKSANEPGSPSKRARRRPVAHPRRVRSKRDPKSAGRRDEPIPPPTRREPRRVDAVG